MMRNRYLVTGGAGFIGSHIVRRLVGEGELVRVVDNLSTGQSARLQDVRDSVEFVEGDLADERVSDEVVSGVDYVLHQAAVPSVQRSVRDPIGTNRSNVTATLNILESCRKAGVRRLVYAASSSAYGDTEVLPKVETMAPNPLSPYAAQKLMGEYYCSVFSSCFGLDCTSLRFFNVYGPRQDPGSPYSGVLSIFMKCLLEKTPPTIFGDGAQTRDFTYVEDVVELVMKTARTPGTA